ncbi:MAG TPA: hypothetical protein VL614_00450 [Acetobacteraceae bacterium]|jgi:hypothetical protein|nr:hypothetical protein [Acetobacteraceae bacterium]
MEEFHILVESATPGSFVETGEIISSNATDAMDRCVELAVDGKKYGFWVYESVVAKNLLQPAGADPNAPPLPTAPPVNVDVPYVSQNGAVLSCTLGNWDGSPTSYLYLWQLDGTPVGTADTYPVQPADVGKSATCTVSATNDAGTTSAPVSNAIVVT